jgi:hypothetical protein
LATLRRIVFVAALIVCLLLAAMFVYGNPQPIDVDLGFVRLERVPTAAAFAVAFGCGWAFGLLSAGLALLRNAGEKRRLRKDLRYAETELSALRATPVNHAD